MGIEHAGSFAVTRHPLANLAVSKLALVLYVRILSASEVLILMNRQYLTTSIYRTQLTDNDILFYYSRPDF